LTAHARIDGARSTVARRAVLVLSELAVGWDRVGRKSDAGRGSASFVLLARLEPIAERRARFE
jgi:hypothetical protein